jgi:intergrase/recombinase
MSEIILYILITLTFGLVGWLFLLVYAMDDKTRAAFALYLKKADAERLIEQRCGSLFDANERVTLKAAYDRLEALSLLIEQNKLTAQQSRALELFTRALQTKAVDDETSV